MIRVLHLMGQVPDLQTERSVASIAREAGDGFSIATRRLGRGGIGRNFLASVMEVRQAARNVDVIHAWDTSSAWAAALAAGRKTVFSSSDQLCTIDSRWLIPIMRSRGVRIACAVEAQRQMFIKQGMPASAISVIRPAAPLVAKISRDESFRQALGIEPNDRVLLALGESTRSSGHHYALWTASILHVLDPRWRLLLWGRGGQIASIESLAAKFRQPRVLSVAERRLGRPVEFETLLPAADLVIATPAEVTTVLPIELCVAGGLPIVASAGATIRELLSGRERVSIVPRRSPTMLAQRVLSLAGEMGSGLAPSYGTPREGWGEGLCIGRERPSPLPLPEYRERKTMAAVRDRESNSNAPPKTFVAEYQNLYRQIALAERR